MPNRRVHTVTGVCAGAVYALHESKGQPDERRFLELIGGMIGGGFGGRAPDLCEPSLRNPRHRGVMHSELPAYTLVRIAKKDLRRWQRWCRETGERLRAESQTLAQSDWLVRLLKIAAAIICDLVAGMLAGFIAGYLSHLALDFCTPASVGIGAMCR